MGFRSMMSRDACAIFRIDSAESQSSGTGATVRRYTAAARGQLPKSNVPCRVQEMSTAEAVRLGMSGNEIQYKIFFPDDPAIETQDRLKIILVEVDPATGDDIEAVRVLKPHGKSRRMDSLTSSKGFHVMAVEDDALHQDELFPL